MDPATEATLRQLREKDLLRAPCPGCGSQLAFQADTQQLGCGHCGATQALTFSRNRLVENRLDGLLVNHELNPALLTEQQLFSCPSCGARTRVAADQPTLSCGFCGSRAINPEAQRTRLIEPAGVLPFRLSRTAATDRFRGWIGTSWLAPNDLAKAANLDNLHGIYLPFWTFDAQAHSDWDGERGDYYYVTVSSTDGKGRSVTRQERRTRWTYRNGVHDCFYDDVLTLASRSLTHQQKHVDEVLNYDLQQVVDYDARVLLGWEAEVYAIDLAEGLDLARATVREREEAACSKLLGGDTQRGLRVDTTFSEESFKHLLLPLWLCAYTYRGKLYHFLVNGQTGKVSGSRPLSFWKVLLLVLLGLLVGGLALYAWNDSKSHTTITTHLEYRH
ncbi:primosomal protein N' (replication factor Y) - superfamily II helicase [Hymenobacter ruricola]|uniref:Primosomal protein N' (Replication factor Y) -superfamily II helicase n=1 Tax=Hymenobacter ruricola TaxID=2791023 RepID=A0ABS0IBI8_9BACT|nr:primosomal protein N' (replication factor Y) - superfamily II helicase [Hymenobacter ruricola]MBF9224121.1 primosomal protein N' (replication factor Y) - superfamily II helicase [Hymenobacter ruricola]